MRHAFVRLQTLRLSHYSSQLPSAIGRYAGAGTAEQQLDHHIQPAGSVATHMLTAVSTMWYTDWYTGSRLASMAPL